MKPLLLTLLVRASALAETRWLALPAGAYTTASSTVRLPVVRRPNITGKTPPPALTNHPVV